MDCHKQRIQYNEYQTAISYHSPFICMDLPSSIAQKYEGREEKSEEEIS